LPITRHRLGSFAVTAIGVAVVAVIGATTIALTARHPNPTTANRTGDGAASAAEPLHVTLSTRPGSYLGVYERGVPRSYAPVERFALAVGRQPNLVLYYSGWGDPFQVGFARQARAHHAIPFVQMEPWHASMAAIASGRFDAYLASYAHAVAAYRYPVLLGFAHEMNGNWYPWGWTHADPANWIAAWRHVVTTFRRAGARNVTWIWTANQDGPGNAPLRAYWPGPKYVDWIGITGYLYFPQQTFAGSYVPTIEALRRFAHRPILISEVAVGQRAGQAGKIPGLFSVIRTHRLLGFVWFDKSQDAGPYHQDWRLEGHPAAISVFRRALRHYPDSGQSRIGPAGSGPAGPLRL